MEPILVYGFPLGSSMGLVAALEWLDQPYRLCRVDMLGEMREAAYARLNARHETPVLVSSEGRPVSETMAIGAWLAARDHERRISFDPLTAESDRMLQLMGFLNTGFTGAFSPLWAALEMPDPDPVLQDSLRRWGRENVLERHDRLEELAGSDAYLVGSRPTLADALFIGIARWIDTHEVADMAEVRRRWPRLADLRARLEADPAVVYATTLESGANTQGTGACLGHVPLAEVLEHFGAPPIA